MSLGVKTVGTGVALSLLIWGGVPSYVRGEISTSTVRAQSIAVPGAIGIFWNQFLLVLQSGSSRAIRSHCTAEGYRSLASRMNPKLPPSAQWKRLSNALSKLGDVRWQTSTSISAYGRVGPIGQEQSISLVLTPRGWKLDQWSPSE